jgi:hypothetical protein
VEISFPIAISKLFLDINLFWGLEFTDAIIGSTYLSQANPQGVILDRKPGRDVDTESDNGYMTVTGPEGAIVTIVDRGDLEAYDLIRASLVNEDFRERGRPKDQPGTVQVGYVFKNSRRIPKGTYCYSFYHYYPHPFSDRKVKDIMNMIYQPVEITIRSLNP